MPRILRSVNCLHRNSLNDLKLSLSEKGFRIFELDGENIKDAESFFFESVKLLPQDPPLSGSVNWDAFLDSLWGGLDNLGEKRVSVIWTKAERMLERGLPDILMAVEC